MKRALVLLLLGSGCRTAGSGGVGSDAAGAVIMTGIAAGASVARRASGECYVPCLPGTYCDLHTGLCEALPCHDQCKADEVCDPSDRCVPAASMQVNNAPGAAAPLPVAPVSHQPRATRPEPRPAPPSDVPAADPKLKP